MDLKQQEGKFCKCLVYNCNIICNFPEFTENALEIRLDAFCVNNNITTER